MESGLFSWAEKGEIRFWFRPERGGSSGSGEKSPAAPRRPGIVFFRKAIGHCVAHGTMVSVFGLEVNRGKEADSLGRCIRLPGAGLFASEEESSAALRGASQGHGGAQRYDFRRFAPCGTHPGPIGTAEHNHIYLLHLAFFNNQVKSPSLHPKCPDGFFLPDLPDLPVFL